MFFINRENKKRWQNDSFIKHQNELILKLSDVVSGFYKKFDYYFNSVDNRPESNSDIDMDFVNDFFSTYSKRFKIVKCLYTELSETHGIKICPLADILSKFDYTERYVQEHIDTWNNTIVPQNETTEITYSDYIDDLTSEFKHAKSAILSTIQSKLK